MIAAAGNRTLADRDPTAHEPADGLLGRRHLAQHLTGIAPAVVAVDLGVVERVVEPTDHLAQLVVRSEPRGVVALFGPWNFAFSLVFAPLAQIVAAGNTCIVDDDVRITQCAFDLFSKCVNRSFAGHIHFDSQHGSGTRLLSEGFRFLQAFFIVIA